MNRQWSDFEQAQYVGLSMCVTANQAITLIELQILPLLGKGTPNSPCASQADTH